MLTWGGIVGKATAPETRCRCSYIIGWRHSPDYKHIHMAMKIVVVRGRVVRKEEGKLAEVFTLVIKGTVEEKWFENSSQYSSYIEITEKELDDILAGDTIERLEQDGKEVDELFRL